MWDWPIFVFYFMFAHHLRNCEIIAQFIDIYELFYDYNRSFKRSDSPETESRLSSVIVTECSCCRWSDVFERIRHTVTNTSNFYACEQFLENRIHCKVSTTLQRTVYFFDVELFDIVFGHFCSAGTNNWFFIESTGIAEPNFILRKHDKIQASDWR